MIVRIVFRKCVLVEAIKLNLPAQMDKTVANMNNSMVNDRDFIFVKLKLTKTTIDDESVSTTIYNSGEDHFELAYWIK